MYMAWCIFILQNKSIVYIFLLINSCIKLFLEYFSSLVQYSNILPVFVLQFFLFCIIVSNVGKKNTKTTQKKEFFEVYRVLWVLEFVETDLEDQHLRIKIFYIYKVHPPVVIWGVWFLLLLGFVSASTREEHLPSLFPSASCTLNFTVGATSSSQPMSLNT